MHALRPLLLAALAAAPAPAQPPPVARPQPSATSEPSRLGGEYFVQRAGAAWTYQAGKGKARWSINSFTDWKAFFSFSFGKKSGSGTWRVKDGVWLERSLARTEGEAVVLPAVITVGTRWTAPPSIERGGKGPSTFEVLALDATVELPNGKGAEQCLAVLETGPDGAGPYTHYYAPNLGKVAVRGPEDWVLRLVEFYSGQRGHSE